MSFFPDNACASHRMSLAASQSNAPQIAQQYSSSRFTDGTDSTVPAFVDGLEFSSWVAEAPGTYSATSSAPAASLSPRNIAQLNTFETREQNSTQVVLADFAAGFWDPNSAPSCPQATRGSCASVIATPYTPLTGNKGNCRKRKSPFTSDQCNPGNESFQFQQGKRLTDIGFEEFLAFRIKWRTQYGNYPTNREVQEAFEGKLKLPNSEKRTLNTMRTKRRHQISLYDYAEHRWALLLDEGKVPTIQKSQLILPCSERKIRKLRKEFLTNIHMQAQVNAEKIRTKKIKQSKQISVSDYANHRLAFLKQAGREPTIRESQQILSCSNRAIQEVNGAFLNGRYAQARLEAENIQLNKQRASKLMNTTRTAPPTEPTLQKFKEWRKAFCGPKGNGPLPTYADAKDHFGLTNARFRQLTHEVNMQMKATRKANSAALTLEAFDKFRDHYYKENEYMPIPLTIKQHFDCDKTRIDELTRESAAKKKAKLKRATS